jgi:predicted permease
MFETIWQDVKHGARMLVKNPGFAIVAIISIAIGVGANAAMFSVADGLVLRPLPVPRAGEVVTVSPITPGVGARFPRFSYPDYVDVRDQSQSVHGLVAYGIVVTAFAQRSDEQTRRNVGMAVSGNFFDAMEIRAGLGRTFRPDEDRVAGRDAVVVLDYDEWAQRFAADPGIVNRRIRIGGQDFTVIGVASKDFTGIDHDVRPAFYVPIAMFAAVQSGPGLPADALTRRDSRWLIVKGRLRSKATMAQARADVHQIAGNLQKTYPNTNQNQDFTVHTQLEAYGNGPGGGDTNIVVMLMTLAFAVLIVACANVAGLLTSRAPVRAREIALRLAVGASRFRMIRQLLTESLLIAIGGGALGLAISYGVIAMFQQLEFPTDFPLKLTFALDVRVLMVGIVVAAASAAFSSLLPAWQATRADLVSTLKNPTAAASRRSRLWGRSVLVSGQVALTLVLLTVSVFLYRAFQAELREGPGFRTSGLLMMAFDPGLARYDEPRTREFYRLLTEKARAIPGVTSVTLTSSVPMKADTLEFMPVAPEGFTFAAGVENVSTASARIDEGYFETLEIPIVRGRGIRSTDTENTPLVAVVNEAFASHYWPGQNAIGKRVRLDDRDRAFAEVVGIAANVKYFFIAMAPTEFVFRSRLQNPRPNNTLLVASDRDATAMVGPLRDAVRVIDPNMPVFGVRTMEDFYFSRAVHTTRLIAGSVNGMGLMGLVLSMVGLYGLVAYTASRRTREIGIRMAVGAAPGSVLRMVLRQGLILAAWGIALGVAGSVSTGGLLRAVFPSQGGMSVVTYLFVVPTLVAVTLLAAYIPARRAARTNPLVALRTE